MLFGFERIEFAAQVVQKQRVDDFVNVFDAGVVHATLAPSFSVERRFKDRAKNRRRNSAPIKAAARLFEEEVFYFGREVWNFNRAVEEPAVDVRKFFQRVVKVRVAVVDGRVENFKQVEEVAANISRAAEIIAKNFVRAENARRFGVKAEDESHAKFVEADERFVAVGVAVLGAQGVVKFADNFARLE